MEEGFVKRALCAQRHDSRLSKFVLYLKDGSSWTAESCCLEKMLGTAWFCVSDSLEGAKQLAAEAFDLAENGGWAS